MAILWFSEMETMSNKKQKKKGHRFLDNGPTKKRKQNQTINTTIRGKILEKKKNFWKKREKDKVTHPPKPTNKFLFFYYPPTLMMLQKSTN